MVCATIEKIVEASRMPTRLGTGEDKISLKSENNSDCDKARLKVSYGGRFEQVGF